MLCAIRSLCVRPQIGRRSRWLVRFLPRQRRLFSLGSEGGLLQLFLLLLCRELRRSGAAPLTVEMGYILLVDLLLFLRRRVRTRGIEASVLHEIEIGIAATRLAASGKLRVAFGERRGFRFLARRLLRDVGAFLEIGGRARPPLRIRAQRRQRGAAGDRGNQQDGFARHDHDFPQVPCDTIPADCGHYRGTCPPRCASPHESELPSCLSRAGHIRVRCTECREPIEARQGFVYFDNRPPVDTLAESLGLTGASGPAITISQFSQPPKTRPICTSISFRLSSVAMMETVLRRWYIKIWQMVRSYW